MFKPLEKNSSSRYCSQDCLKEANFHGVARATATKGEQKEDWRGVDLRPTSTRNRILPVAGVSLEDPSWKQERTLASTFFSDF